MRVLSRAGADAEAARLLGRLLAGYAAAAFAFGVLAGNGAAAALLPMAAMLLGSAGLAGGIAMALARARVAGLEGAPALIGRAARRPQASLVPLLALGAIAAAWLAHATPRPPLDPATARWVLAGAAIAAFALLVAERHVHALPPPALPEAPALARLLALAVAAVAGQGALLGAAAAGLPWTGVGFAALQLAVAAVALEVGARGLARWFLPPPEPGLARAAVDSLLLRAARRPSVQDLATPLRDHFGIDFSRSWALAYARSAVLPLAVLLLMGCWLLSGVVLVPLDRRVVAERFGAPVAVLPPGLHVLLPWPLGRALPVEFGTVHEATLTAADPATDLVPAEAPAPASADRLWESAHPAELLFLVASPSSNRQSFQIVSADIRVLYRIGLADRDAVRSVTATADPAAMVRSASGRAVAAALAGRTLDKVLATHDELAAELRKAAQGELDRLGSGLEIVAVVVEAIHPPPGAAAAYHGVQAAEIAATTTIATERGRAQAALAMAAQRAATRLDTAQADATEQRLAATAEAVRFAADRQAAQAGGRAFLIERTEESLVAALAGTPKTILDRRLGAGEPTVIDLRPLLPPSTAARDD